MNEHATDIIERQKALVSFSLLRPMIVHGSESGHPFADLSILLFVFTRQIHSGSMCSPRVRESGNRKAGKPREPFFLTTNGANVEQHTQKDSVAKRDRVRLTFLSFVIDYPFRLMLCFVIWPHLAVHRPRRLECMLMLI